jgi:hypothetical protein
LLSQQLNDLMTEGFFTMTLENAPCDHCGKLIEANSSENTYSIKIFYDTCQQEVTTGALVAGALHYCSDQCMFERKIPSISYERYLELNQDE